ncbi:MAG: uroporphyrinogen-III synthase, partial [Bacteroidales bacterium]
GKVIISTRAVESGDTLPDILKAKGANVFSLPMIEILPALLPAVDKALLEKLENFDWIFFTSKNGVANFFKHLSDTKGNTTLPTSVKLAVIGGKTALELEYYGYSANFISHDNTSVDLLENFYQSFNPQHLRILLSLGNLADDTLSNRLSKENDVKRINVYQTVKPNQADASILEMILQDQYDLIVFTSPSTYQNFCSLYKDGNIESLKTASIGSTTTKAINETGLEPLITAKKSSVEGLSEAIETFFKKQ